MAKIKSFTDLEQSQKLAEILPLESADMRYFDGISYLGYKKKAQDFYNHTKHEYLACWSLSALLGVLPTLDGRNATLCKDIRYDEWHILYHSTATLSIIDTERYDNPVDACVDMIYRLHELKKLGEQNLANSAKTCKDDPKASWSEEDEACAISIIEHLKYSITNGNPKTYKRGRLTDWIFSLKERCTWKPSDAQMQALKDACEAHWDPDGSDPLYTLFQDLRKLRGAEV